MIPILWKIYFPTVKKIPGSTITLLREVFCMLVFVYGPYSLLGITFAAAGIVKLFMSAAKRLKWNQKTANGLGLDVAALFIRMVYRFWHGQEFNGIEHIPPRGGALVVWYHGPMPCDYFALIAEVQFKYGRQLKSIIDRCLKKIPGSKFFIDQMGCICEDRGHVVEQLQDGHIIGVAPGGSREALFGKGYSVEWGKRTGFAHVAINAKVPIIPVFTENIREAYATMSSFGSIWRYIFEATKLPIIPIWGGFPVKLITHIGAPIYAEENETVESFKSKAKFAIEEMMRKHQTKNPTVLKAIIQRVRPRPLNNNVEDIV